MPGFMPVYIPRQLKRSFLCTQKTSLFRSLHPQLVNAWFTPGSLPVPALPVPACPACPAMSRHVPHPCTHPHVPLGTPAHPACGYAATPHEATLPPAKGLSRHGKSQNPREVAASRKSSRLIYAYSRCIYSQKSYMQHINQVGKGLLWYYLRCLTATVPWGTR